MTGIPAESRRVVCSVSPTEDLNLKGRLILLFTICQVDRLYLYVSIHTLLYEGFENELAKIPG